MACVLRAVQAPAAIAIKRSPFLAGVSTRAISFPSSAFARAHPTNSWRLVGTSSGPALWEKRVGSRIAGGERGFFTTPGRVVDPAPPLPLPGQAAKSRTMFAQAGDKAKTYFCLRRLRAADPPMFNDETFPKEAGDLYRKFMVALNKVDRSVLKDMVTDPVFSEIKKLIPDKKQVVKDRKERGYSAIKTVFVVGDVAVVQARTVELTAGPFQMFAQVTCMLDVMEPTRDRVQVVFERLVNSPQGRWRICELPLGPTAPV